MNSKIKQITSYFRSSIAAQVNTRVEFKADNYCYFSFEQLMQGKINENIFEELCKEQKNKKPEECINVILVGKTIRTIFDSQEKINSNFEDLTGIYFIPALLAKDGTLLYSENKLPWIPREFLYPMVEAKLSMGYQDDYDHYMSDSVGRINKISNWNEYIDFAKDLYESITKADFESNMLGDTELENQVYIIKDNRINAVGGIKHLYDALIDKYERSRLYKNFLHLEHTPVEPLITNHIDEMGKHCGQMSGEYPLSPSQRECINHFNHMKEGEILAVNGPPGTGKTTLLQSIVANMYVERALKKNKAPVIVASSTNNQAVTNIIESFGKIKQLGYSNLEMRWIEGVESFAVYFPSSSKEKNARNNGYHYTNLRGQNFISDIEREENIEKSKEKFLKNCQQYFGQRFTSIDQCEKKIHDVLNEVNCVRKSLLDISNKFSKHGLGDKTVGEFLESLQNKEKILINHVDAMILRVQSWKKHFNHMPIWYKIFKFIKAIKRKIEIKNRIFIEPQEDFINEYMNLAEIEEKYSFMIKHGKKEIHEISIIRKDIEKLKAQYDENLSKLSSMGIEISIRDNARENKKDCIGNLEKTNALMDTTLRYIEFWLSVHYYECRWVKGKDALIKDQKGRTYRDILEKLFNRLSMVTPCYVMTFYQLPKNFLAYNKNNKFDYLYNFIDLLIVDEAGQVSPEIAACSFSLAKKAIVVGDEYQIEPVWSVDKALDQTLALEHEVIEDKEEYDKLRTLGVNASNSSVMKVASKSCKYLKYENRGLFLSEHRRCYDEIISYCNELVYNGHLEPMRGPGTLDEKYTLNTIPQMGYRQVDSEYSLRKGSSRYNKKEASEIANWIKENFEQIQRAYPKEDSKNLIGVISPFKAQVRMMEKQFKEILPENIRKNISIGTVHTFQGAERQIIIISTVYGKSEGCYFIDANPSMLNVAVSRAKDSFLVFGDIYCFSNDTKVASGLLKNFIKNHCI